MHRPRLVATCAALSALMLSGCAGGGKDATTAKPLASEACGFLLDAGKILISDDPPSQKADVLDRAVDKAVRVAHRAKNADPAYSDLFDAMTVAQDAVETGDSQALAAAIRSGTVECTRAVGVDLREQ